MFETIVIKLPNFTVSWNKFLRGLVCNMEEFKTWSYNSGAYESGKSHLLCPVIWASWGGWILIMKRADPVDEMDESVDIRDHKKHFRGDDVVSNYGWLEGKLVKIDYGDLDHYQGSDFKHQNKLP